MAHRGIQRQERRGMKLRCRRFAVALEVELVVVRVPAEEGKAVVGTREQLPIAVAVAAVVVVAVAVQAKSLVSPKTSLPAGQAQAVTIQVQ